MWWQAKHRHLGKRAKAAIDRAERLLVPTVACFEVAILVARGRVKLDRTIEEWIGDLETDARVELVPLSARAAAIAYDLELASFRGDPADRMIYAAAVEHGVPLVTADERMSEFAESASPPVTIVW